MKKSTKIILGAALGLAVIDATDIIAKGQMLYGAKLCDEDVYDEISECMINNAPLGTLRPKMIIGTADLCEKIFG